MSYWKSIAGSTLAVVAALFLAGSTLGDPGVLPRSTPDPVSAAATFISVVTLHWLLWRFIVPARSASPAAVTAFMARRSRRGFFGGAFLVGYAGVALYCLKRFGYLETFGDPKAVISHLIMGLFLIGLGTAERLREVIAALNTLHESPSTIA